MSASIFTDEIIPSVLEDFRPGLALDSAAEKLGPLADLAGTWIGSGFNLISLPGYSHKSKPEEDGPDFFLMLNTTVEILEFEPIGAQVPNRGSYSGVPKPVGQPDIDIYGLRYLQRVADGKNHQPLHVEPGFWLYMPTSTVWPVLGPSVVRQAVIPHGNSLLALGEVKIPFESTGKPNILETSSIPTRDGDPNFSDPTYLDPFKKEGKYVPELQNPNKLLEKAIEQQNIIKTVTLHVSAENPDPGKSENEQDPECKKGRIGNIPFLVRNANVTEFKSTFWIETVRNPGGTTFLQLQYTQRAILNFRNIDWPHISVATLIKQ